jgi:transcriptional regulator with XRE-family HTH domain
MATDHPLRRWRQANGLNLKQVAQTEGVGVSPSHLSEIERGRNKPSLDLAVRLSRATGGEVKVEEFVGGGQ